MPLPTTDELRKKQVEWFLARVTSEKAKAEFAKDLGAAYDALVARPVGELVNLDAVTAAVEDTGTRAASVSRNRSSVSWRGFTEFTSSGATVGARTLARYSTV